MVRDRIGRTSMVCLILEVVSLYCQDMTDETNMADNNLITHTTPSEVIHTDVSCDVGTSLYGSLQARKLFTLESDGDIKRIKTYNLKVAKVCGEVGS